jgi:hypothetical protein
MAMLTPIGLGNENRTGGFVQGIYRAGETAFSRKSQSVAKADIRVQ